MAQLSFTVSHAAFMHPAWHALTPILLPEGYASISQADGSWRIEVAGEVIGPEAAAILGALDRLPTNTAYLVVDPEQGHYPPEWIDALCTWPTVEKLAAWDGSAPDSSGYGDVRLLRSPYGLALAISIGGSPWSSAASMWVMPLPTVEQLTARLSTTA